MNKAVLITGYYSCVGKVNNSLFILSLSFAPDCFCPIIYKM
ncbi:Uncharacterised protein [Grimontia hollisae]|nr:Uncharacterised protein [Grimontia hollisae]